MARSDRVICLSLFVYIQAVLPTDPTQSPPIASLIPVPMSPSSPVPSTAPSAPRSPCQTLHVPFLPSFHSPPSLPPCPFPTSTCQCLCLTGMWPWTNDDWHVSLNEGRLINPLLSFLLFFLSLPPFLSSLLLRPSLVPALLCPSVLLQALLVPRSCLCPCVSLLIGQPNPTLTHPTQL